jgi:Zn-dependent oligopeptidase
MSTAASTSNPLLKDDLFPLYSTVSAEHVVPGIKTLIEESMGNLKKLESDISSGLSMPAADFIGRVEKIGDKLGRSWSVFLVLISAHKDLQFSHA